MPNLTLEQLKQEPAFNQLTDKAKSFVEAFIKLDGNYVEACKLSYNTKDDRSARAFGRELLSKPTVSQLLDKYYGTEPVSKEQFEGYVWRLLKNAKGREAKELAILFARLKGWDKATTEKRSETKHDTLRELIATTELDTVEVTEG